MKLLLLILAIVTSSIVRSQTSDSFIHNGINRNFIYYTPSSWTQNESLPVLFVLHGLTQDGNGIMNITGFNAIAEANNFIACYPDGINAAWNANMNISASQADDIGFLEELALYMQTSLNTNPNKQYLCGFSNGGFMSHKMICESNQCFAAIATLSGTMSDTVYQNCNPQHSPDILHIHGTLDGVVNYNGSPTTGISVDELMEKWRAFYNCDLTPSMTTMPNPNILDFSYPERYTFSNCDDAILEHIKVIGGGHQWPGIPTIWGGLGTINMDFYSPQIIWDFLEGKECPLPVGVSEFSNSELKDLIKIIDLMGRETELKFNTPLIFIYSDGTRERVMKLEE
jgi:polyhydroxybutyrate depolymerase